MTKRAPKLPLENRMPALRVARAAALATKTDLPPNGGAP